MSETAKSLTPEQAARVDHSRFDAEKIDRPTITYWQGAWRRLKKNPLAVVAMVMLAVVLFFVLLGPTISGQEYIKINASIKNTAPNSANWFGTDTMGRDIFCVSGSAPGCPSSWHWSAPPSRSWWAAPMAVPWLTLAAPWTA